MTKHPKEKKPVFIECRPPEPSEISPDHGWAVFHPYNFADRGFKTETEADAWLQAKPDWPSCVNGSMASNERQGWRGPIPIVARIADDVFAGPYLKTAPPPVMVSSNDLLRIELGELIGNGQFVPALEAANSLGLHLPAEEQERLVLNRAARYSVPEIECRLKDDWGFNRILADVRCWQFHAGTIRASSLLAHLFKASRELESCLLRAMGELSTADVYNFWTSLQVHQHLRGMDGAIGDLYSETTNTPLDKDLIIRWIGSYAAQFRPSLPASTPLADSEQVHVEDSLSDNDIEKCKAARKKLRDAYKAACKRLGRRVNHETIAHSVNGLWHSRTQIDKWLQCDPRYNGEPDRLIRQFLTREIQRLSETPLKKPHR